SSPSCWIDNRGSEAKIAKGTTNPYTHPANNKRDFTRAICSYFDCLTSGGFLRALKSRSRRKKLRLLTARSKTPSAIVAAVRDRRNRAGMCTLFGAHRAPLQF